MTMPLGTYDVRREVIFTGYLMRAAQFVWEHSNEREQLLEAGLYELVTLAAERCERIAEEIEAQDNLELAARGIIPGGKDAK